MLSTREINNLALDLPKVLTLPRKVIEKLGDIEVEVSGVYDEHPAAYDVGGAIDFAFEKAKEIKKVDGGEDIGQKIIDCMRVDDEKEGNHSDERNYKEINDDQCLLIIFEYVTSVLEESKVA